MLKALKNQKGLTLIELLVVVVILAIIAAIAIPAVGGLIDNSRKDAHASNATQMINSAKLAVTADAAARPNNGQTKYLSLEWLQTNGYIETVRSADPGTTYHKGTAATDPIPTGTTVPEGSHVRVTANDSGNMTYSVRLLAQTTDGTTTRGVRPEAANEFVAEADVNRSNVR